MAACRHVALIMDGNGRWARARRRSRAYGHRHGVNAVDAVIRRAAERDIPQLTLFAFSSENAARPRSEVQLLMRLFAETLHDEKLDELEEHGVGLRFIGDLESLGAGLRRTARRAEERLAGARRLTVNVALGYGGRWDIAQAAETLLRRGERARGAALQSALAAALSVDDVDLLIRTGGERRLSNFLLWQCAYAELYFTDTLWPDFDAEQFERALAWFAGRERRFGRTPAQARRRAPVRRAI